jgi:arginine repressor
MNPMTEHERKIAVLLTSILQGNLTIAQLRRRVADGKAQVKKLGLDRVGKKQIAAIAAGEEALARIERERVKYDRLKNN